MTAIPDAILVFVRAPEAGRVKTRLAAEIGADAALRVYRRLAEHAVAEARALGPEVALRIHFTPAEGGDLVRSWLGADAANLPQEDGDLGARMRAAFEAAFAAGHPRVLIIGSDLPGLSAEVLRRALRLLDSHRAAIGPAADGGYYLLALRRMVEGLFDGIAWSTDRVLDATLARLAAAGCAPAMLEPLRDVDEAADLPPGWREWARGEVEAAV
ncbi:MAG TPA: TIGR04282 family arsenosugar biosynthesis glycosyltransferase [Longimicrobium sp.]|nr:TIGR04282 family arsenosugar biosynthesis glycosyltransferase [Longimicrobium sp.]